MTEHISGKHHKIMNPPLPKLGSNFCCWSDLLGFGSTIYEKNWCLEAKDYELLNERVSTAHNVVKLHVQPMGEFALVLNDGMVRSYDSDSIVHLDYFAIWLRSCITVHNRLNQVEAEKGLPGTRTVLTHGPRLCYDHAELRFDDCVYTYTKPNQDPDVLSKAARAMGNPVIYSNPRMMQLNLAFSKAYILENYGSKHGLAGSHFYVDESVINELERAARTLHNSVSKKTQSDCSLVFSLPKGDGDNRLYVGLELELPEIQIATDKITTSLWRLMTYYPFDEEFTSENAWKVL